MFDSPAGPPILTAEIRAHCEMMHKLAAPLTGQGKLVIGCFGEDAGQLNPKTGAPGRPLPACVVQVQISNVVFLDQARAWRTEGTA